MSPLCLIMFGPPGSGKGTQAKQLKKCLSMAHISTGDMLRDQIASGYGMGKEAAALLNAGRLVPDELVNLIVGERTKRSDCEDGFILDGYPRSVGQAEWLATRLLPSRGIRPVVVHLKVDYNKVIARLSGRRQCPYCGALYGAMRNRPRTEGFCDLDGNRLEIRDDDREDVVRERLRSYDKQTTPVLEFLEGEGFKVHHINGDADPAEISKTIMDFVRQEREKVHDRT